MNGTTAIANFLDEMIEGNAPAHDKLAFICKSCTGKDIVCPAICQYCLPKGKLWLNCSALFISYFLTSLLFNSLVDGNWGEWSNWGPCDATCGVGERSRKRSCDNPAPKYGGQKCDDDDDEDIETEPCIPGPLCPGKLSK